MNKILKHFKHFKIPKCWEQPKYPSANEWIKTVVHLHNGILFSRKKEGIYLLQQHGWNWRALC